MISRIVVAVLQFSGTDLLESCFVINRFIFREPSARFGVNTSTYCSDKTGGEKHFLRNSGINGSTAYHMVSNFWFFL